ncbi:MAG: CPBP family intramembrane glutamic endopeptidase [Micrococcales bacterium]
MTEQSKKHLVQEVFLVLGVSLGVSAVYSVVSVIVKLLSPAGLAGSKTTINGSLSENPWLDLTYQLLGIFFDLVPALLALYLLRQTFLLLHQDTDGWLQRLFGAINARAALRGIALAAAIGVPGIGLYLLARELGWAAKVIPADLGSYWWTVPVLLLSAAKSSFIEEVIVVGYLLDRLKRLGLDTRWQMGISAVFRGSYHLYQGFGGFIGNAIMGIVFGLAYKRWGKLMPLLIAHFIMDAVVFIGYTFVARLIP